MGSVNLGQVAAFIDSVSVESIAEGATPTVRNEGTASNARFVFGLPTDSGAAAAQSRQAANESEASALISEGHAVGQQNGVNVDTSSPYYHNNSKYYSEQAATSATSAAASEERTRNMLSTKQDVLTFDSAPTSGSINPVTSGGVFTALANLGGYKVIPSLASITEPDEKTIYLVKDSTATGSDKYEEYIWQVEQGVGGWEKIGDTSLDLSPYVQKTDLATANTAGIVKPDGTTITVDANGVLSGASLLTFEQEDFNNNLGDISLTPARRAFTGTRAEWNALSSAQKATYKTVNITDDEGEYIVPTQIVAASMAITGSPLKANTTMQVMFSENIAGVDGTTPLVVTYNGTQIPVKADKGGQLIPVYAKEIAASTFRYIDAYTTLQLFYDGTNFVIVGNPLLLSSDTYSIYANGKFENDNYALDVDIDTGRKWIDGKPIYRIVRHVWHNAAPVIGYSVSGHVISGPFTNNADTIIKFEAICVEINGHIATMGGCGYVDETNVWYSDSSAYLNYGTTLNDEWIVIEYTKTTD